MAFSVLTGQPHGSLRFGAKKTIDYLWDKIVEFDTKRYVMYAASTDSGEEENGLVGAHAYTILGATKVTDADGDEHRLVKARNPWASERYSGAWSDDSDLWTEDLR